MKVLLIDDHPLILSALRTVIQTLGDDVTVVSTGSANAARSTLLEDADFDLVLLDLQLGDADGFHVLAELRAAYPALPVVVVSASDRSSDVIRAIDLGAMGYVPKRATNETLCEALRLVMSGGIYVPALTVSGERRGERHTGETGPDALVTRPGLLDPRQPMPRSIEALGLTRRQTEVLTLLLQGQPNKLIARELGLSVETIKDHVAAVLRALRVNSRTQAVLAVSEMSRQQNNVALWRKLN